MTDTNTRRRPNSAARADTSQDVGEGSNLSLHFRSACAECRRRKQQCTGDRPTCRFCADKGVECSYEVADGMTRSQDLKLKVREATERGDKLDQLVDAMRRGTDQQSSELLARLRVGATIDDLLDPESRLDHFPEYLRNGEVDRSAWLKSSGIGSSLEIRAGNESRTDQTSGTQTATTEEPRNAAGTLNISPTYSFDFSMPGPRLSSGDNDQPNDSSNQAFHPS